MSRLAARQFFVTLLVAAVLAGVLAAASYYVLRSHPGYALLAVVLAIVESLAGGIVVGFKRAIAMAAAEGVRSAGLGRFGVRLIFERLLGAGGNQADGEKGRIAQTAEKLPLAQAERRLNDAVGAVLRTDANAAARAGWFRRLIQVQLLRAIGKFTLRRFRAEDAQSGGVDLAKVGAELENKVDDLLASQLQLNTRRLTLLVTGGLVLAVIAQAAVLRLVAGMVGS